METTQFEDAVIKKFNVPRAPTVLARTELATPIAFTRLSAKGAFNGRTLGVPPERAFTFQVALAPMRAGDIWTDGKHGKLSARAGETFAFDLTTNPIANLIPPYDYLRFYLPVTALDQLADDRGLRRVGGLRTSTVGIPDRTMHGLAMAILPVFQEPAAGAALFLDSIACAFHAHAVRAYGAVLQSGTSIHTGLAPWQLRRATDFMEANLDGNPSMSAVARECRLSASHFARAFRQTTGMPPHRWLTTRRVARAKVLLLEASLDLSQIALACGFFDQSHFTRTFARYERYGPGKWRRLRRS
jgi:AraC-like DNA-binding protein